MRSLLGAFRVGCIIEGQGMSPVCAIIQATIKKQSTPVGNDLFVRLNVRGYRSHSYSRTQKSEIKNFSIFVLSFDWHYEKLFEKKSLIGEFAQDFGNHFSQWSDINDHCILSPSCFQSQRTPLSLSVSCVTKLNSEYSIFGGIRLLAHSGLSSPVSRLSCCAVLIIYKLVFKN